MTSFTRAACAALFGSLIPSAALAQAVDYATLQETIGEPVTTSVTGKPQRASETPASIEIITRDQIAHSPAHDVPGLLKSYAGVDVNRWTAGQTDVAVRGGVQTYNPRLLVLVDGRQVYLDHYGMTDWNLLGVQLEEIQQIELVRGPATALFGFNAASAVVNIITRGARGERSFVMTGEAGTHGYNRLSAVATLPFGENVGLRLSAGHQREHERDFGGALAQPSSIAPAKRDEIDGTLEAALDPKTLLTVNGGYSRNAQLEMLPTQVTARQVFQVATAGVRVDRDTDWGAVTGRVYANWLDARYGHSASGTTSVDLGNLKNRIVVAQGSALVRLGLDNALRFGVEYRGNRIDGENYFSPRVDYTVWSGSGMLDLHPTERLAFTVAGRIDHMGLAQDGAPVLPAANLASDFDRQFVRASFNAAVLLKVGADGQLRANGGLGYQVPSLINLGVRLPIGPFPGLPLVLVAGRPQLAPVAVWSGELGYTQPLSDAVRGGITFFFTRTNGVIASPGENFGLEATMIGGFAVVTRFGRDGDFRTRGIEASLDGKVGEHFNWRANYTLTDTKEYLQPISTFALSPDATTARNKVNIELGYVRDRWFATTVLRYTSATRQFGGGALGAIVLFDVKQAVAWDQKIGVTFGKATLSLTGENLTHARGAAGSPVAADRRAMLGLNVTI